ncbi:MAG: aldehyde ferredoxin oxidoreductase family protein [Nitrospiraceae bacterium]|nr:MAG: aldehyde ferredoxin oxidoreductase family protein [Nitrospiraceae bacterium]
MYKGGYTGKILRINLTDQTSKKEDLSLETAKDFIGGAGFGIKYLYDEVKADIDPFDSDNKLIFAPGPFSGTSVPCASRMSVTGKSPLTGTVGMALSGGHFPVEMKFAGYDALIVEGKAEEPTYVWIKNGDVKFRSAKKAWGLKTTDAQQVIKNELKDQNIRMVCIGPAGENLSKVACIINEMRAAGRKGLGAVMGAKNLKAVAVRGTGKIAIADKEKFKVAKGVFTKAMKDSPGLYKKFAHVGTGLGALSMSSKGIYPAKNFTATGEFTPMEEFGVDVQKERTIGREYCYGCPVGCSQLKMAKTGVYAGTMTEGPEYETTFSLGGQTGVSNYDAVIAADRLCDELGLDTVSAGVAIGFGMELFEKGIISKEDTGGIDLKFGNDEAMMILLRQMAYREGFGDILTDGVKVAAEKIGKGSEDYAIHVKGLELPGYDVRGSKAQGLNYATSYTGADHNRGYAIQEIKAMEVPIGDVDRLSIERKGELTVWNQDVRAATCDSPTMCAFLLDIVMAPTATQNTADLMEGVTGLTYTPEEVQQVGERINNLAKAFNMKAGFTRADDTLPKRLMTEPIKAGVAKGQKVSQEDLDYMLNEYYRIRGWDEKTGTPTREKLTELGLEYVADDLGLK